MHETILKGITQLTNLTANQLLNSLINLGEKSGQAYIILNSSHQIIHQNKKHEKITGFSFDDIHNNSITSIIGNSKTAHYYDEFTKAMYDGSMLELSLIHKKYNAKSFSSKMTCIPLQLGQQTQYILVMVEDVTEQRIEESIVRLEHQFSHATENSIHFVQLLEQICYELNFVMAPHCFATIAWTHDDMLTLYEDLHIKNGFTQWIEKKDPRYSAYADLIMEESYKELSPLTFEGLDKGHVNYAISHHLERAVAIPLKFSSGEQKGAIILYFDDITRDTRPFYLYFDKLSKLIEHIYLLEQRKNLQCIPSFIDASLQIPNYQGMHYFLQQKEELLADKQLSVALISPNEFNNVIELFGHDAGELLLKKIIKRISDCSEYDIVLTGRFSSSIIYVIVAGPIDFNLLEQHLQKLMLKPYKIKNRSIYITVKTGIATQLEGHIIEETARQAEIALSKARQTSGTTLGMYDVEYANQIEKELFLLNHLIEAIKQKEIQVYFQPKVELHRGRIDSMEALARWISPTLGFISPAEFIPIAERNGLIHKIDILIIEQVLVWLQQRQYDGKRIVPVSVNISAEHFYHPDFINQLMALVHKYYADPKYIVIEITERLGLEDIERAQKILHQLNLLNFTVSVDDFGIGYSSLSYLQKLSFRELKIDMSFVRRLDELGTQAIVQAIINIAKNLEMRVIAEGVETEEQVTILKTLGCDVAQGYFYYKPMPVDAVDF